MWNPFPVLQRHPKSKRVDGYLRMTKNELKLLLEDLDQSLNVKTGSLIKALESAGSTLESLVERLNRLVNCFDFNAIEENIVVALLFDRLTAGAFEFEPGTLLNQAILFSGIHPSTTNRVATGNSPLQVFALL